MRRYLLDTSLLAAYLYGRLHAVELITPWITRREAATSILVYGEVVEHLKSKPDFPQHHASLRRLLREVSLTSLPTRSWNDTRTFAVYCAGRVLV